MNAMSIMKKPSQPHKEYAKYMTDIVKVPKTAETKENTDFKKFRAEKERLGKDPAKDLFQQEDINYV